MIKLLSSEYFYRVRNKYVIDQESHAFGYNTITSILFVFGIIIGSEYGSSLFFGDFESPTPILGPM